MFLTLVGGGVFQNKYEWIAEAIRVAYSDFPENISREPFSCHFQRAITSGKGLLCYYIDSLTGCFTSWESHYLRLLVITIISRFKRNAGSIEGTVDPSNGHTVAVSPPAIIPQKIPVFDARGR